MSTLKADAVTTKSDNTDLVVSAQGSGVPDIEAGFKVGGTVGVPISGLRVGTDGELITWDASGDPAAVAVGTATHVLTSNGAGAAPTFQAAAGGGKLLQVVNVTNSTYTSTTSTSFVTANLAATLTPSATSSKVFILYTLNLYASLLNTSNNAISTIFRGTVSGTNLGNATVGFSSFAISGGLGSSGVNSHHGGQILDSPNTTSAQTYTIGMKMRSSGTAIRGINGTTGSLTIMEIGA